MDRVLRFYRQAEPGSSVVAAMSKPKWIKAAAPRPRLTKRGLARYAAPDGTVVYTNLPAGELPVSIKELLEGRKDEEGEVVAFLDQID